jgi:nucleotide-binding universal stress UspA family protein
MMGAGGVGARAGFEEIAVGFDDSERGRDAVRLAELLARTTGGRLVAVRVYPELSDPGGGVERERLRAELDSLLGEADLDVEPLVLAGDSPARALHELASTDRPIGLIVLGSTHRAGLGRVTPGSVADRLLSGAPCPVAVAPRDYRPAELRVIAVGFDGSVEARAGLELAARLGQLAGATLRVVAIGRPHPDPDRPRDAVPPPTGFDLQSELHAAVSGLPAELRALPVFQRGTPVRNLIARAEEGVDLLVVGSRGYGPLRTVLLGSVSAAILDRAPCPVLVTPRSAC